MLIKIEKVSMVKNGERGFSYDFSTRESGYFIFVHRKQGTVSGNHYHRGKMASKSPEIIYLVSGSMKLTVRDVETGQQEIYEIEEGTKVEIPPNIHHTVEAKRDIILLELLISKKDSEQYESDTFRL